MFMYVVRHATRVPGLYTCRLLSSGNNISEQLSVVELAKSGTITQRLLSVENILQTIPKKIPLRDLRLLLRKPSSNVKKMPALLPRPSSNCYILDIEHIRILCYSDKVNKIIILYVTIMFYFIFFSVSGI